MKNKLLFQICIMLLLFSCKKENNDNNGFSDIPEAICTAPEPYITKNGNIWGDGTPGSCTEKSLQDLINKGGIIVFNGGDLPYTLFLNSTLKIPNRQVVIDGKGLLTISGKGQCRIFDITSAAYQGQGTLFAIQNMTLKDGYAKNADGEYGGGAIFGRGYGTLQALNVNFENNTGAPSAPDDCGAVHTVKFREVLFANCNFINNSGANGGAVGTIGSAMSFINCRFENNKATGSDGTNSNGGSGGAIYVDGINQNGTANKYLNICGCVFEGNTAGYQAGALNIVLNDNTGSYAIIDKCIFNYNSCLADKGGACYFMNGDFTIHASTFSQNNSPVQGGAIWLWNTDLIIENCTFWKNFAVNISNGLGGAVCVGESNAKINNCTFSENRAGEFASAIFNGGSLTLSNNIFCNNLVGNGYQSNPYGGAVINKDTDLRDNGGNLQYPDKFTGRYGTTQDYWITQDVLIANPLLESIADNGGPTPTMAIPANSQAKDNGTSNYAPKTDQRGMPRNELPDIGAYEIQESF